jgi:hypothetical protein
MRRRLGDYYPADFMKGKPKNAKSSNAKSSNDNALPLWRRISFAIKTAVEMAPENQKPESGPETAKMEDEKGTDEEARRAAEEEAEHISVMIKVEKMLQKVCGRI